MYNTCITREGGEGVPMAKQPIDLAAVRRIEAKIDRVLAAYPELQERSPERQQAFAAWNEGAHTMADKATGKTRGRPKTKEYVTLLARVPVELAELVKRYAKEHRQSVAEIIREGAEWRIGDGDPRGKGMYLAQPTGTREKVYYTNTETSVDTESAELLREIRAEQVRLGERLQAVMQALEPRISGGERVQLTGGPGNAGVVDGDGDI